MFKNLTISVAMACSTLMSATSEVHAATACNLAASGNFDGSTTALNTWIAGTNGGSDDFVTVSNGTLMCEFSDLEKTTASAEDADDVTGDFFSAVSSWTFADKEDSNFTTSGFLQSSGSVFNTSGDWKITDSFFDIYNTALLVFKDGSNNPEPFVGYKVTRTADGDVTGTYSSMFFNGDSVTNAVSHISLYGGNSDPGGGGPTPNIPLPAGLPLLLSALGVGGLLRLRQRKVA